MSELRNQILEKVDVLAEYMAIGIRIAKGAKPNAAGWLPCHSFHREDKNPSAAINVGPDLKAKGIYVDFGENGTGGKPWLALGVFDMLALHGPYIDRNQAFYALGRKYGVITGEAKTGRRDKDQPPTLDDVARFKRNLTPEMIQDLRDQRGLTEASIARFDIGWDPSRGRNTIPVWEPAPVGKRLVNIRFHNSKKTPKTLNWPGFGEARLFGLERLAQAPPGSMAIITEGECFPGNAEVLTPDGWVPFSKYNGEPVVQVKEGGAADFVRPKAFIKKPYKGKFVRNYSKFFTSVSTPKHQMVSVNSAGKWLKHDASKLLHRHYKIPRVTWIDGPGIPLNEYQLMLTIAVSADATIDQLKRNGYNNNFPKEMRYARFGLHKGRKISRLRHILDALEIEYSDNRLSDGTRSICFSLPDWVPGKVFPSEWLVQASLDQRLLILGELLHWDGNSVPNRNQIEYSTIIKENADFVQSMAHTSGMVSTIMLRKRAQYSWFKVSILLNKKYSSWQSIKTSYTDYQGEVYCVQVSSGMILVRQEGKVYISGNCDAMLADQVTGFIGVSSTNGVKAFKPDWVKHFHGRHVVLLYDADKEGREGVHNLVLPAFREAVESGRVLSLKVIWLYDKPDKEHKDLTDWIVTDGGSGEALKKLIEETPPYAYPTSIRHLPDPIELKSFTEIDKSENAGQRVTVDLQVFGENTVAYYAAMKIKVTHCQARVEGKCNGPKDEKTGQSNGACQQDIPVPMGDRILIAGVRATESQFKNLLRDYVCDRDKRPTLKVEDTDKIVVREVFAHQIFEPMQFNQKNQLDKPIYVLGGDLVEIGKYQATGRIVGSYRDQQPVLLVDTLVPQDEDYQCFDLDAARPRLKKLQAMDVDEIALDLSYHVTRIYKRQELHLGVLLVLCSPLWINFPGEGRIRGWLSSIIVGDTGTGKTSISQGIFEFARAGDRVSGLTASRTGITYGLDHDERKGWRVKAGALLKMSRQALIVDEAQDLPQHELKTMAEGLDTGLIKIDRIQHKTFESTTRTIFSCNPRDPKQFSNQRKMEDFRHGCQALEGLFPDMMLRRVDLFLFATSGDIENKEEIFNPPQDLDPPQVTAEDLRALIFFAWNLKEDQVVISPEVGQEIRHRSLKLSRVFGCDKPPIVYPEDFRKTLARLAAAYAVLDLSTNEDFTQVIVLPDHVSEAALLVDWIYRAENCRLDKHAQAYRESYGLDDLEDLKIQIDKKLDGLHGRRFARIMAQLLRCQKDERLRKNDLAEEFDVDKKTIQREMSWFVKNRLVKSNIHTGYSPEPRLFKLIGRLEKLDAAKYSFSDHNLVDESEGGHGESLQGGHF